jgi:hypothetical protein
MLETRNFEAIAPAGEQEEPPLVNMLLAFIQGVSANKWDQSGRATSILPIILAKEVDQVSFFICQSVSTRTNNPHLQSKNSRMTRWEKNLHNANAYAKKEK